MEERCYRAPVHTDVHRNMEGLEVERTTERARRSLKEMRGGNVASSKELVCTKVEFDVVEWRRVQQVGCHRGETPKLRGVVVVSRSTQVDTSNGHE